MFNAIPQPLLADIGEVVGSIVALVTLVLWVIQKIAEANKAAAQPRGRMPVAPAQPQPVGQGGARPAGQQADPLRNQVEEFLRRAGKAPQQGAEVRQPQPAGQSRRDIEILLDEDTARRQRPPLAEPLRPIESRPAASMPSAPSPKSPTPSDVRPQRRSVIPRKRKTLAERADERASARTRAISEQASHLGERIVKDDQQFDVQLKAKFDHTVGTLTESAVPATESKLATSPAAQIAAMLANPDGVRQAIILNEILRRPSDRW